MTTIASGPDDVVVMDPLDAHFVPIGLLGGTFGQGSTHVWLAHKRKSKRPVAVKCTILTQPSLREAFDREVKALRRIHYDNNAASAQRRRSRRRSNHPTETNNDARKDNRDLFVVYIEQSFLAAKNQLACLVLQYAPGGTLAQWLQTQRQVHSPAKPSGFFIPERRIAWYAAQLTQALAYCHERGVAHLDVKSANVLLTAANNGHHKLLLSDFGNAVLFQKQHGAVTHENSVSGFTEVYAAPELLRAYHANSQNDNDDNSDDPFAGLDVEKLDAFSLGCILYELVCGQKLVELSGTYQDPTIGQAVYERGVDVVLQLPCVSLPWLPPPAGVQPTLPAQPGYSNAMRHLLMSCLHPNPAQRWAPLALQHPILGRDPLSPLTTSTWLAAAHPLVEGDVVTVDNVQLGMLVQRHSAHWTDGDADGGPGSVGVIVELDVDAGFCFVAWPWAQMQQQIQDGTIEPQFCRIGDRGMYELLVGPVSILPDFVTGSPNHPRRSGRVLLMEIEDRPNSPAPSPPIVAGQKINADTMIMRVLLEQGLLLVSPLFKRTFPANPLPPSQPVREPTLPSPQPAPHPSNWSIRSSSLPTSVYFYPVTDEERRTGLIRRFMDSGTSAEDGFSPQDVVVESIHAIESMPLWKEFSRCREKVKSEYWGFPNERSLFWHTRRNVTHESVVRSRTCADLFREQFFHWNLDFSHSAKEAASASTATFSGSKQLVLCHVVLGRSREESHENQGTPPPQLVFHSESRERKMSLSNASQAYPEYLFTYKHRRRTVRARRISSNSPTTAATPTSPPVSSTRTTTASAEPLTPDSQECVLCMDKAATHVMVPCGHVCLCDTCATPGSLMRLHRQCPICRAAIQQTVRIYGARVVNNA